MQDQLSWVQSAFARILRPAVRLALALGLKHPQLEETLRDLLLDEARHLWRRQGVDAPNLSQLSITTGLNRKDVTARAGAERSPLPATEGSAAAKAYTAWMQLVAEDPAQQRLRIVDGGEGSSFELLARFATRGNVHHRTILEELKRLGLATVQGDYVSMGGDGFVPAGSLQDMLAFLGDNARDHLMAAVSNTLGGQPRMLERAVYANGLTLAECERIHELTRRHWEMVHYRLVREMTESVNRSAGEGDARIRVGIYTYFENDQTDQASDRPAASAVPSPDAGPDAALLLKSTRSDREVPP